VSNIFWSSIVSFLQFDFLLIFYEVDIMLLKSSWNLMIFVSGGALSGVFDGDDLVVHDQLGEVVLTYFKLVIV
jgi:hypothetical protein